MTGIAATGGVGGRANSTGLSNTSRMEVLGGSSSTDRRSGNSTETPYRWATGSGRSPE